MMTRFNGFALIMLLTAISCQRTPTPAPGSADNLPGKAISPLLKEFSASVLSLPEGSRDSAVLNFIKLHPQTPIIENDSVASLYWYGKAKQVLIHGDCQHGWEFPDTLRSISCGDSTLFYITYILPSDSRLDYVLQADTTTGPDPRNPVITPSGYGPHSQLAMPAFRPDPALTDQQDMPHGTLKKVLLDTRQPAIRNRQAIIYLPHGYDTLSALPAIYVTDGIEAMDYMSYPIVLDNLIASGRIRPVIAVFIPPAERHTEYLGEREQEFLIALCEDFVPFIDQHYKTAATAESRLITGISSGGHFALLVPLLRPDVFLNGAGQSPTIQDDLYKALNYFTTDKIKSYSLQLYIDVGLFDLLHGAMDNQTFLVSADLFHATLLESKIQHQFNIFNDGHEWANWRERTSHILLLYFPKQ
jgi:enterochelin esterase-like enzyme